MTQWEVFSMDLPIFAFLHNLADVLPFNPHSLTEQLPLNILVERSQRGGSCSTGKSATIQSLMT